MIFGCQLPFESRPKEIRSLALICQEFSIPFTTVPTYGTDHASVIAPWHVFSVERTTQAAKSHTSRGWSEANLSLSHSPEDTAFTEVRTGSRPWLFMFDTWKIRFSLGVCDNARKSSLIKCDPHRLTVPSQLPEKLLPLSLKT